MHGEIITIGDELILGRVVDLNSFFLSGRVSSYGLEISDITSVGDDPRRIIEVLTRAVGRSEFVLVTGGLGPTADDLTTEVAATFFKRALILDESLLKGIQQSFADRGLDWVEAYRKLAYLPEGARLIDPLGQVCGFYLEYDQVPVFFLPGVPHEVRGLTEKKVLPLLLSLNHEPMTIKQRLIKVFGPPEGRIGELLNDLNDPASGIAIGYYPNFPENHVTITVRTDTEEKAFEILARTEAEIESRLGRYIVAKDKSTLENTVGQGLKERGLRLAVAESCTGGQISQRLTSISGSSDYFERSIVAYSNQAKIELLNVPVEVIERYGAVSPETARAMAQGIRSLARVDLGLATTGIAGPTGGTPEKPVGTVYIALAASEGLRVERFRFFGRRHHITAMTSQTALVWLKHYLTDDTFLHRP